MLQTSVKFLITLTALAALPILGAAAQAEGHGCTAEAGNPSSTIQQAVDRGCADIRVKPGTYYENVVIPAGRMVSLAGQGGGEDDENERDDKNGTDGKGENQTIVDGNAAGSVFTV